ncbi:MAG: GNAT family N-acetyltransferase [Clostridia bacterium]|nr:GNAT family N-acetyltransferase [Clostridia bacterium]
MNSEILDIFPKIPHLYTERLQLRKIELSDLDDMYEYSKDPYVSEYLLWHPHFDKKTTKSYLKYLQSQYKQKKFYDWAVVVRQTGKMIGTCGFSHFDFDNNSAEIGYVLNRDYWGKGYAAEAAHRVAEFAFHELGIHRVFVRIIEGNKGSVRVAEKLGMRHEATHISAVLAKGSYRTISVYAILNSEFK